MSSLNRHCRTFLPLVLSLTAPLLAQKGGHEALDFEQILTKPGDFVPKPPRAGLLPGETKAVWRAMEVPGNIEVVDRYELQTRGTQRLFHGGRLRAALRAAGSNIEEGGSVPPFDFVSADTIRVVTADGVFHWKLGSDQAERILLTFPAARASAIAPKDAAVAGIVDDDLFVRARDGVARRITWDGAHEELEYGLAAHRAEFGIQSGLFWSPDGQRLAFYREDKRTIAPYPYAEVLGEAPAPIHGRYPMAGDRHSRVQVGVYDVGEQSVRYLESRRDEDTYWTNVTFSTDGNSIYVALVHRNQSQCDLVEFDAISGKERRVLLSESDPEWVEPEHGPRFLADGTFLWLSSRGGFRQLWRHAADGAVLWPETTARFDIRSILAIAPDETRLWIEGSGEDPRENHVFEVWLGRPDPPISLSARAKEKCVTSWGRGWHTATVRADGTILDTMSSLQTPDMVSVLPPEGGRWILGAAADPYARFAVGRQEFFTVQTGDGATLHAHAILPPYPDPLRKSPILLYVYGGPHVQLVRNVFGGGASPWLHYMASRGYVVIRCDGRGTPGRGIEFEQAIFRHLGELEVLDQLAAVDTAAKLFPFADRERVGVHGWSYGGYMTLRLMTMSPTTFRCGVSGAPVTDWTQYETGYTERYMDTPTENPDGYASAAVLPYVDRLAGRLLLVHGTNDQTVMWSHAMRFLGAAIAADKLVDFMAYPMDLHGLRGASRVHFQRLMTRYFEEHLPAPTQIRPSPVSESREGGDGDSDDTNRQGDDEAKSKRG
ncbi:MAG: prolyl oligopeptidase family serine peptidase [Planctomycetota bacterium]